MLVPAILAEAETLGSTGADMIVAYVAGYETWAELFCRNSGLATFKRPRRYVFVTEIPKSPVGKLLRRKLVAGEYEPVSPLKGTAA